MRLLGFVLVGCLVALIAGAALAEMGPMPRPVMVRGVIAAIDLDKKSVTVERPATTADPTPSITFFVNEKTVIVKDGKPAKLEELAVKDLCEAACARTSAGLLAIKVCARTPVPPLVRACGVIEAIDLEHAAFKLHVGEPTDTDRRVMEFYVDRGTIIRKDGRPASLRDLKVGDPACVGFVPPPAGAVGPIRAAIVEAKTPPPPILHVVGKLMKIGENGVIAVLPRNAAAPPGVDRTVLFQVTPDTKIVKMIPVPLEALMVGDTVDVAFHGDPAGVIPKALAVHVLPEGYRGVIVKVDLEHGFVVCRQAPTGAIGGIAVGPDIAFKVVPETKIVKNGEPATLDALRPKDLAEIRHFRFREHNVAAGIHARSPLVPPR